jgi:hypothetical protein
MRSGAPPAISRARKDLREIQEQSVHKVLRDPWVHKVLKAMQACKGCKELRELQARKVLKENPAFRERLVSMAYPFL